MQKLALKYCLIFFILLVTAREEVWSKSHLPKSVVSLDYCSDQYVLKLLDRERIKAVSHDSEKPFSYMRKSASGIKKISPKAEEILKLDPDLVIRTYGGGPGIVNILSKANIPTVTIEPPKNMREVSKSVEIASKKLGVPKRGLELVSEIKERISVISQKNSNTTAIYISPSGIASGTGSIIHSMLTSLGLNNYSSEPGWKSLPLEHLILNSPDLIVTASFNDFKKHYDAWSITRHPLAKKILKGGNVIEIKGSSVSCAGWFILDAMETIYEAKHEQE